MPMPSCEVEAFGHEDAAIGEGRITRCAVGEDAVDVHQEPGDFDGAGGDVGAD